MSKKTDALKLALEALEPFDRWKETVDAITAIREALAQSEQSYPDNFIDALKYDVARRDSEAQQAYEDAFVNGTGVMLGDKRIDPASIYKQPEQEPVAVARVDDLERGGRVRALAMGLGLDAPLYIAPPKAQPEQEPVAWKKKGAFHFCNKPPVDVEKWIPLYKSHNQHWQTWAGLTNEDKHHIWVTSMNLDEAIAKTEAKLKEKNT